MLRRLLVGLVTGSLVGLGWVGNGLAQPTPTIPTPSGEAAAGAPPGELPPSDGVDTGRAPPPRVLPANPPPGPTEPPGAAAPSPESSPAPAVAPAAPASAPAPAGEGAAPRPTFTWRPFGYLRVQAAMVQDDPNVAFVGRADGFEVQNARLGVTGQLGTRATVELSVDGAVDEREKVNVPNGRLRVGLRDAYADLRLASSVTVRVGRFQIWFDPDGRDRDPERAFVDRALESRGVRATEGWETDGLPPGRSLGVAARWRSREPAVAPTASGPDLRAPPPSLEVELAAQNGADEFASNNDNDSLALSLAVRASSPTLGWVQLAGRWNQRTEGELPFRQDETDLESALALGTAIGPVRAAAGGVLVHTSFATTGGSAQWAWGAHGQAMVRVPVRALPLDLGYRFAIIDSSNLVLTDRVMEHTAGLVLGLPAMRARLQLNVTHAVEQAARELSNDRLEGVLEVVL